MKVALVGGARTWADAPYHDKSWQIWAHTSCQPLHPPRVTRWFDMHRVDVWRQGKVWYRPAGDEPLTYVDWLRTRPEPIVMQERYPLIPTSAPYPLKEIVESFGIIPQAWHLTPSVASWWAHVKNRGEFTSTAAYMLALALYEEVDEIALYGIDFIGLDQLHIERTYQRPGAKYWIGLARGMGIPVTIADGSWLEQNDWLYGFESVPEHLCSRPTQKLVQVVDGSEEPRHAVVKRAKSDIALGAQ